MGVNGVDLPLRLNVQSPDPLYRQIADQIRSLILIGHLAPGQPLPSIRQLARDMAASVITTKRAYEELEHEGLIVMRPGLGCFVGDIPHDMRERTRRSKIRQLLAQAAGEARRLGLTDAEIRDILLEVLQDGVISDDREPTR